ncbi:MAG: alpha-L-fucosidase 2, partial [Abditibacteriota bacterium]|nr:alpha-L-fucosidase 2 [Abditibacteriota bacterium]
MKISQHGLMAGVVGTSLMMSLPVVAQNRLQLWYEQPAKSAMNEALAIGNGRIGGLVFGGTANERVVLNENSLWTGDENPSGDYDSMGAYQVLGNLHLALPGHETVTGYRRDLDISESIARVRYQAAGANFVREYFCSNPDGVLVVRLTADRPGRYSGHMALTDGHQAPVIAQSNRLVAAGALENGMKYETQLAVRHEGGTLRVEGDRIAFNNCNSLTFLLAAGTDYVMDSARQWRGEAPQQRVARQIEAASAKSDGALKAAHVKDYQSLFNRVKLDLGHSPAERLALPTDRRKVRHAEEGGDPALEELMFQYGRYLLISCSRPGGLPANLQGLWNESNNPPWHSDYHSNINVQMNYWPAEPTNLPECHEPFLNLIRSQLPSWRKATAQANEFQTPAGAMTTRGWAIRTSHNISGGMGWKWDKTANAWYGQHLWEHFAFTRDAKYLQGFAYPILKEICEFWEHHLKTLPDNRLVVPNGWSPEHGPDEDGVSYNQQIVWDLFNNTIEASRVLDID